MLNQQMEFSNGPSHLGVIVSVHHNNGSDRNTVWFRVSNGIATVDAEIILNGATREDGSGLNWLLEGYVANCLVQPEQRVPGAYRLCDDLKGKTFKGFYTLRDRTGWLKIIDSNTDTAEKVLRDLLKELVHGANKNGTLTHVMPHGEIELSPLDGRVWSRALDVLSLSRDWKG